MRSARRWRSGPGANGGFTYPATASRSRVSVRRRRRRSCYRGRHSGTIGCLCCSCPFRTWWHQRHTRLLLLLLLLLPRMVLLPGCIILAPRLLPLFFCGLRATTRTNSATATAARLDTRCICAPGRGSRARRYSRGYIRSSLILCRSGGRGPRGHDARVRLCTLAPLLRRCLTPIVLIRRQRRCRQARRRHWRGRGRRRSAPRVMR